jgi:hypothetical protein
MPNNSDSGAPIVVGSYDLCAALYEQVNRFPRVQRTLLGRIVLHEALLWAVSRSESQSDKLRAM